MPILNSKHCPECGNTLTIVLTMEQKACYDNSDAVMQNRLPHLSNEDRERFISGYCPKCWNKMFGTVNEGSK